MIGPASKTLQRLGAMSAPARTCSADDGGCVKGQSSLWPGLVGSFVLGVATTHGARAQKTATIQSAEASVSAERIREQDKFISDDLFEGRYPGLRGGELAAKYIATQFALMGLTPAGDNGTYLQQVDFVGMTAKPAETSFEFDPKSGQPM